MPRGSHGSLAKAGKVRKATPRVEGKVRRTPTPRMRNKMNYVKRVILKQRIGQPK